MKVDPSPNSCSLLKKDSLPGPERCYFYPYKLKLLKSIQECLNCVKRTGGKLRRILSGEFSHGLLQDLIEPPLTMSVRHLGSYHLLFAAVAPT